VADAAPLYPLYALLFAANGLDDGRISALLLIWSAVGIVAEVPSGALADRTSRRGCLAAAGVLQALAFGIWLAVPTFPGYAVGFVVWGLGGALVSGAQEALLHDGLAAVGAADEYARVQGWTTAAGLAAQVPAALAATALYAAGGFALVGAASTGVALLAALLALRLGEPPRDGGGEDDDEPGYLDGLRLGVGEAAAAPVVRAAVLAVAVLGGFDAVEEYFPLLAAAWTVPVDLVPPAMLAISLAGALGAASAGLADRLPPAAHAVGFAAVLALLGAAVALDAPVGLLAVSVAYGLHRVVLVVVDARLQAAITGPSRATVTSVAGLGTELGGIALFAVWALGGPFAVVLVWVPAVALLARVRR
jgi:MFS family permease